MTRKTSSVFHAKGGHFEYSLSTDNVDFVDRPICNVTCLTVTFLITKSATLFIYKVVH